MSGFKEVLNGIHTSAIASPGGLLLQTFVYNREGHASNIQLTQIPCTEDQAEAWIKENCINNKDDVLPHQDGASTEQVPFYRTYGNSMDYKTVNGLYVVPNVENINDFQDTVDDEVTACTNSGVDLPKIICISKDLAKKLKIEDIKTIKTVAGTIALRIL